MADVNHQDEQGKTPLLTCAYYNNKTDLIQYLIENGADIEISDENDNTPLHFSAIRGSKDIAQFLIKKGAQPYAYNNEGRVPYEEVTDDANRQYF